MMQKTNISESELFIKLELAIKDWYNINNDWPYGKEVSIQIFPDYCEYFYGPSVDYKCDASRKKIRNLMVHGYWNDDATFDIEYFVLEMNKIHNGEYDQTYRQISLFIKHIAKIISQWPEFK